MSVRLFLFALAIALSLALPASADELKGTLKQIRDSKMQGLEMVYQNKADAYAADHTVLIGLALAVRQSMKLRLSQAMFSYEPYGLVMRKDDGDFRRGVNRVVAGLYRSGQIKDIYLRWFGKIGEPSPLLAAMSLLNSLPE